MRVLTSSYIGASLWTILILALCTIPGADLPEIDIIGIDKLVHFVMFAVFGILWLRTSDNPSARFRWVILATGILYGIGTEFYQEWLGFGRILDPFDAIANSLGVTTAIVANLIRPFRSSEIDQAD